MNKFELVLLHSPEIASQSLKAQINSIKDQLTNNKGKIINEESWGLRELSYNINKFKKAFYHYIQLEISGSNLDTIKKDMNQSELLIRYLFVKVKEHQELPTKLNNEKK
tara:strand:+ start:79 stop:405 length:327 start_codon:yes stop_codon:yes gene_type:complete